jgi:hypothetical protein
LGALVRLLTDQQNAGELDLDVLGHDERRVADQLHDGHGHLFAVELGLT